MGATVPAADAHGHSVNSALIMTYDELNRLTGSGSLIYTAYGILFFYATMSLLPKYDSRC